MKYRKAHLSEISSLIEIDFIGYDFVINGLNLSNRNSNFDSIITYASNYKYLAETLDNKCIKAIFARKEDYEKIEGKQIECAFFFDDYPEEKFYQLHELLYSQTDFYLVKKVPPIIGKNCIISKHAIIEDGTIIGNNVEIGPNVYIRSGSNIGSYVKIGSSSGIGVEGFQVLYNHNKTPYLATHVGGVNIANNVSIGCNVSICRSLFEGDTIIEENTKIDNNINISHNCNIGRNVVIVAGSILTGSVTLKDNVWLSPNSVILNKIILDKNSFVGSMSLVTRNIEKDERVFGIPARKLMHKKTNTNE